MFIEQFIPADKETNIAKIKGPEFDKPQPIPIPIGVITD